ncbi:VTT domain-containing protein [Candidatus Parcubacteria bacterium]|nr:VTT domain-containing protein [Candidatus Parcubacteria bacterium]
MSETASFIKVAQDVVLEPSFHGALSLLGLSFVNDVVGIFPFALALAGQLFFLKEAFTLALSMKLLVFVAIPVGIGSSFGSIPLYLIAYFGGKPAINKLQKYVKFSWKDIERVQQTFKGTWYDEVIFLLLRCVPVLPSMPLDVAAGIFRMSFMPFFVLTVAGSIVRMMLTLLVVGLGMHGLSQF